MTRAELFAMGDPTRKAMPFHDLRATGITWCAVRVDDPLEVKQRAGHRTFSTTEGYLREAENLADGFGEVFPPLPPSLLVSTKPAFGFVPIALLAKNKHQLVETPGIEDGTRARYGGEKARNSRRMPSLRHEAQCASMAAVEAATHRSSHISEPLGFL